MSFLLAAALVISCVEDNPPPLASSLIEHYLYKDRENSPRLFEEALIARFFLEIKGEIPSLIAAFEEHPLFSTFEICHLEPHPTPSNKLLSTFGEGEFDALVFNISKISSDKSATLTPGLDFNLNSPLPHAPNPTQSTQWLHQVASALEER